ncbi:hypothetical protein TF3313_0571 [Tannerella forsythia 3313]|nr:hypothetical protein TF3313_0571 [Tannerella forsythia 3313]
MVNATQMAKSFNKEPKFWLSNQSTADYLTELSKVRNLTLADLVIVTKGGNNSGTWMHEDVALEFARWLSPAFAIWCNDRIKELITSGVTTVSNDDEVIAQAMSVLQKRLDASKQQLQIAQGTIEHQEKEIKHLAPKAQYTDEVLQSTSTYTMTQVAKEFGYSANTFAQKLRACGIMFLQSGQWMLTSKYQGNGYTNVRTHTFTHSDGRQGTNSITVWTEKGRKFLHDFRKRTSKLQDRKEVAL